MTVTSSLPYATKKATASRKSSAFSIQERKKQCIQIATKEAGYQQNVLLVRTVSLGLGYLAAFGSFIPAPAPGRGRSTQRLNGTVPAWSFATIWGKNAR